MPEQDLLGVYLSDHFAGSTVGLDLAERMADTQPAAPALRKIAGEIGSDRETLREVMDATGVKPPLIKSALGWLGEKVGRLKPNERIFGRSPLSDVLELEGLIAGVSGKLQLWRALQIAAERDSRLTRFDFAALATQAEEQRARLEDLHRDAAGRALRS